VLPLRPLLSLALPELSAWNCARVAYRRVLMPTRPQVVQSLYLDVLLLSPFNRAVVGSFLNIAAPYLRQIVFVSKDD
jgi:hypothetical protein